MAYANPAAGKLREGRPGAAVPDLAALTSGEAAGAAPTKAEHDAVVADLAAARTKLNALLAQLRAAGIIAT